jgi:acyl-CoA thioesterase-2
VTPQPGTSGSAVVESALEALDLRRTGDLTFEASSVALGGGRPVFGGQLIGQVLMAGAAVQPDKHVRTVQVMFPRTGDAGRALTVTVEPIHLGRTMATVGVAVTQGERHVCRATVLLDSDEADVMRHGAPLPETGGPDAATPAPDLAEGDSEVRLAGGVDLAAVAPAGPPELHAWIRWPSAPAGDRARNHALAAWYTDSLMIGAAMRPHAGIGMGMAHESLSTGVVTHALTFHEAFDAAGWHLVSNESSYAGGGRVHGTGRIHTADGRLVASFAQDAFVRAFPPHVTRRGASSGVM